MGFGISKKPFGPDSGRRVLFPHWEAKPGPGTTRVHLTAEQDRAGSGHRIWGWQQHMKILLSLLLLLQGNSSSPLFLPPSW